MINERQKSMQYCLIRIIADGEKIINEMSCKFGHQRDIEVEIFHNEKEWILNKEYDLYMRLIDFDSYIGEFTLKNITVVDDLTTLYFI